MFPELIPADGLQSQARFLPFVTNPARPSSICSTLMCPVRLNTRFLVRRRRYVVLTLDVCSKMGRFVFVCRIFESHPVSKEHTRRPPHTHTPQPPPRPLPPWRYQKNVLRVLFHLVRHACFLLGCRSLYLYLYSCETSF